MNALQIFDRNLLKQYRNKTAKDFYLYDFIHQYIAKAIIERINFSARSFDTALSLGTCGSKAIQFLEGFCNIVHCDLSIKMLQRISGVRVVADEEFLPFVDNAFDLIIR